MGKCVAPDANWTNTQAWLDENCDKINAKVNLQIETLDPLARLGSDAFAQVCPLPSGS